MSAKFKHLDLHPESVAYLDFLESYNDKSLSSLDDKRAQRNKRCEYTTHTDRKFDVTRRELFVPSADVPGVTTSFVAIHVLAKQVYYFCLLAIRVCVLKNTCCAEYVKYTAGTVLVSIALAVYVHPYHFIFTGGIPVFTYTPHSLPKDPTALVYFHGGGGVLGNRMMVDTVCKVLAE